MCVTTGGWSRTLRGWWGSHLQDKGVAEDAAQNDGSGEGEVEDGRQVGRVGARDGGLGDNTQQGDGDASYTVATHDGAHVARVELAREAVDGALYNGVTVVVVCRGCVRAL